MYLGHLGEAGLIPGFLDVVSINQVDPDLMQQGVSPVRQDVNGCFCQLGVFLWVSWYLKRFYLGSILSAPDS